MKFESKIPNPVDTPQKPKSLKERITSLTKNRIIMGAIAIASMVDVGGYRKPKDYSEYQAFNTAFKQARQDAHKSFIWKGEVYTTQLVSKEVSDNYFESKRFLEEYYSSEYFKGKQIVDKIEVDTALSSEMKNDPRLNYLANKKKNGQATKEEKQEYIDLFLYYIDEKNEKHISEVGRRIDELKTLRAKNRIDNLNKPSYFSITEQKGDMKEDGSYKKGSRGVYIYDKKGDTDELTSVHELTHKSTNSSELIKFDTYLGLTKRALESLKNMSTTNYNKHSIEFWDYLINPTEIDARQNSTRFWLYKNFPGYKADTVYTLEHHSFLVSNYTKIPYDVKQLMDLFPEPKVFIENMNKY